MLVGAAEGMRDSNVGAAAETTRRPRGLRRVSWTGCVVSTDTLEAWPEVGATAVLRPCVCEIPRNLPPSLSQHRVCRDDTARPRHLAKATGTAGRLRSGDAGPILTDPGR